MLTLMSMWPRDEHVDGLDVLPELSQVYRVNDTK